MDSNVFFFLLLPGFKGNAKPTLLRQETQSLACALRMLFRMSADGRFDAETRAVVSSRLIELCFAAVNDYLNLPFESYRGAWTPIILLVFSRILQLSDDEVSAEM